MARAWEHGYAVASSLALRVSILFDLARLAGGGLRGVSGGVRRGQDLAARPAGTVPEAHKDVPPAHRAEPTAEGAVPAAERGVPAAEGGAPLAKAAVPLLQRGVPEARCAVPEAKAAVPKAKGAVPQPKGGVPLAKRGVPENRGIAENQRLASFVDAVGSSRAERAAVRPAAAGGGRGDPGMNRNLAGGVKFP
jgi:hypothetical protein